MKVHEFIKILQAFEDQDADVFVVEHRSGTGYYEQGGTVAEAEFNKDLHLEYTDLRGNPLIKPEKSYFNKRSLLIGVIDE